MSENSKSNQDEIEKKFTDNKESLKIFDAKLKLTTFIATISISALGVGIVALSIFSGVSLQSEKRDLISLRDRVSEQVEKKIELLESSIGEQVKRIDTLVSKLEREPNVIALTIDNKPLEGQTIETNVKQDKLKIPIIFSNIGTERALLSVIAIYTKDELIFEKSGKALNVKDYQHQKYFLPEKVKNIPESVKYLPAKLSYLINLETRIIKNDTKQTSHPIMLKIFYGGEKPNTYECYLKILN